MIAQRSHSHLSFYRVTLPLTMLLIVVSGLFHQVSAQNQVNILQADRIEGGTHEGAQVQKIIGNVHLQSEDLEMFCDSAFQFVNRNEIRAYGNIEINTEAEKIWSDTLTYFTDVDFSQLRGRVIIEADSTTLFGNSVDYRFTTRVAHFMDEIRLEDPRGILLADSGYYFRAADSAEFQGQVQLADSLQYLEGDSLFSNRSTEYYEMYGNIYGYDEENNSMLRGEYLEADSTGRRYLEGDAWLKNFEADTADTAGTDTTHIRAHIIVSQQERSQAESSAIVHAFDNVRIWSPSFSAVGDTSLYTDSTQTFELWSNSIAWHDNVQLTGPYIKAILNDGDIDSLESFPQPFSVQQDTVIDRLNQITGDTLQADFVEGDLEEIFVFGNGHLLRFTRSEAGEADGAIELNAPSIRILFEQGELDTLLATGAITGSYLPENPETAARQLDGYAWNPEMRPQRPDSTMERRFPVIPTEIFFDLPRLYLDHLRDNFPESPRLAP